MGRALVFATVALAACGFQQGALGTSDGSVDPTGDADAPDGRELDAFVPPGFNPGTDCPAGYGTALLSTAATSRYRVIVTLGDVWTHELTCRNDKSGFTHMMTPSTLQEVLDLDAFLDANQTLDRYYIGGVQSPTALVRDASWIGFDGVDLIQTAWHTPENEPDDLNTDLIENHEQQVLILDRLLQYFHDATGGSLYGTVCECDAVPITAKARAYFDMDPNNPNP